MSTVFLQPGFILIGNVAKDARISATDMVSFTLAGFVGLCGIALCCKAGNDESPTPVQGGLMDPTFDAVGILNQTPDVKFALYFYR
ncbi:hypothetical protein AA106555_0979 [Neokomagataea thailandica NBRC 106555]|uniref:Uncharacterized protein n=1 Tax=Neokomagataea thailandica NBRC 106555 TaxID=1223520 RepID=A0ABQ0QPN3_9PROT|nr:hypothetical protein AA106555_0979 [Neokomagataea thailandica NBRC 106555]